MADKILRTNSALGDERRAVKLSTDSRYFDSTLSSHTYVDGINEEKSTKHPLLLEVLSAGLFHLAGDTPNVPPELDSSTVTVTPVDDTELPASDRALQPAINKVATTRAANTTLF